MLQFQMFFLYLSVTIRAKRNHEELKDGEEKQPPAKMQKPGKFKPTRLKFESREDVCDARSSI